jgi:hypothetical protein
MACNRELPSAGASVGDDRDSLNELLEDTSRTYGILAAIDSTVDRGPEGA